MRRRYGSATVEADAAGHRVLLDGKPLLTPARAPFALPTRALAEAIAAEWAAQGEQVQPQAMPLTRLAATAIDRIAPQRERVIDDVAAYAATDLVCYRADEPAELAARQAAIWQPVLDWLQRRYDVHLQVTSGIRPVAQGAASLAVLRAAVAGHDDLQLAALQALTAALGSLVLALATLEAELSPEAAFAASQLDESFQIERWGEDEEAMLRREEIRRDILATARFLALLRP